MDGFTKSLRARTAVLALALFAAAVPAATGAINHHNRLKLSLKPSSGKQGSIYKIHVTGYVKDRQEQLALTSVIVAGTKCPKTYTGGFSKLSGLAKANGDPMGPRRVPKGALDEKIKVKVTQGPADEGGPATYAICGYLQVGPTTKAHAASEFTVTP